uniref:Thioredoxin n=1 Tax=Marseillevirus LCMAC201 TaxID=2506605 RepID=A0A481YWV2_9VIRU|nr:MAG: thioredoxin [Marseillevirus LCMAC201]
MGITEHKDKSSFDDALKTAGSDLVVVDFFATWCGPCKRLAPQLEVLAAEKTTVHFYKVNVDVNELVATKYKIFAMPTIIFIKNGKVVQSVLGADLSKINAAVTKHM